MTDGSTYSPTTFARYGDEVRKETYLYRSTSIRSKGKPLENLTDEWVAQVFGIAFRRRIGSASGESRRIEYLQDLAGASGGRLFSSENWK